jgi:hypothetical protein
MRYARISIVMSLLSLLVIVFSRCNQQSSALADSRGDQYAGAAACVSCHKDVFNNYSHTNHYKTSSLVNADSLKKVIASADDSFHYDDSSVVRVQEKEQSIFQTLFLHNKEINSASLDMAFGSGEKAQTYAYWKDGKLQQLPLTFFSSMRSWINSPGFPMNHANFNRVIIGRCFECHASFINKENVPEEGLRVSEKLDRNSIIYGIDCERCHGPAAAHVEYQRSNPSVKEAKYIVSIKDLSRQRQLDLCAACHSGNDLATQRSLFSFVPGDTLSHFYFPEFGQTNNDPDVHGKQMQLLQSSRCFQASSMTCTSCHNSHEPEESKIELFMSKCMSCHQGSAHATNMLQTKDSIKTANGIVAANCIECHMPLQPSRAIYFKGKNELKTIPYLLRTHRIGVYK